MQAVIICGGLATRLHPITETIPKSLIEIKGKPLLYYQLKILEKQGISDVILCVGHLSEKIQEYVKKTHFNVSIGFSKEETLLGTAGAVRNIPQTLLNNSFIVLYGDILTNTSLDGMYKAHKKSSATATILVRKKSKIGSSVLKVNQEMEVLKIIERPKKDQIALLKKEGYENWVNSGIYILEKKVLDLIPLNKKYDFSYDVFPALLNQKKKILAYPLKKKWYELGRLDRINDFEKNKGNIGFITSI